MLSFQKEKKNSSSSSSAFFVLLHDRIVTIGGLRFGGSPWMTMGSWCLPDMNRRCDIYHNLIANGKLFDWNASCSEKEFVDAPIILVKEEKVVKTSSIDILISHVPPLEIRDQAGIMPVGCHGLKKALQIAFSSSVAEKQVEEKEKEQASGSDCNLILHMFGHAHGQFGIERINIEDLLSAKRTFGKYGVKKNHEEEEEDFENQPRSVVFSNAALANHRKDYRGPNVFEIIFQQKKDKDHVVESAKEK